MERRISLRIIALLLVLTLTGCKSKVTYRSATDVTYNKNASFNTEFKNLLGSGLVVVDPDLDYNNKDTTIDGKAALIYNVTDNEVLFSKNAFEKMYPASTTKILTCLCAIKYGRLYNIDFQKEAKVSDFTSDMPYGAKLSGIYKGDKITLEQVMYCMMLESGNDAAMIVAENIAGSVDAFVELMNKEAKALGATHSHFCNPHGLFEEDHYTTAYDLYLIMNAAVKETEFLKYIQTREFVFNYVTDSGVSRKRSVYPTNKFFLNQAQAPKDITVIGGKTGYEELAGRCLVIYSSNPSDDKFISVVLNSSSGTAVYESTSKLMKLEKE